MNRNASIVRGIQEKIDEIVREVPRLLDRLDVVMASTALFGLCDQEPELRIIQALPANIPCPLTAPILNGVVTDRAVENKREELREITDELVLLFERIRVVLDWHAFLDICSARRQIVILPEGHHEPLRVLDVYCDHLDTVFKEQRREEVLQELDSSPSSVDSYNR